MANNIGVRSPHFVTFGAVGGVFFRLSININQGEKSYVLEKSGGVQVGTSTNQSFDISELVRDYIDITYDGTMDSGTHISDYTNGHCVRVGLGWQVFDVDNPPQGTQPISTGGVTVIAYDSYKLFDEPGVNAAFPQEDILLTTNKITIPEGESMTVYYTSGTGSSEIVESYDFGVSHPEGNIILTGYTLEMERYECSKHDPVKLVFVNRYGMLQELWFFGRTTESSSVKSEDYKSSNIAYNGVYNRFEHQFKRFDVFAKKKYIINSGFVGEHYNPSISEMLMSEQVWMHIDGTVRPITIVSSDVTYKTSLNDKLVEYTLEVEQANDLISTMR